MAVDRSPNRSVLIGSGIVAATVAVAVLIFFIPAIAKRLRSSIHVVAVLADVGALKKGAPVWIGGKQVGSVDRVEVRGIAVDSAVRVAVHLRIPKRYADQIRSDSRVRITTQRMIGDPLIDIVPGSATAAAIQDRDTIGARMGGTIDGLLVKSMALTASFHAMFEEGGNFQKTAADRTEDVKRVNARFQIASAQLHDLMADAQASPMHALTDPEWQRMMDHLMGTSRELQSALQRAARNARKAKGDAMPAVERLQARADTIMREISALRAGLSSGNGLIGRAARDSAIVKGIHEAQVQLDSLIVETKRNPLRFWF